MENKKPDNPYAFACVTENFIQEGMTLRDYFASKEKQVLTNLFWKSKNFYKMVIKQAEDEGKHVSDWISELSYIEADAMLKQREL